MRSLRFSALGLLVALAAALVASPARADEGAICERVAQRAAAAHNVPLEWFRAIALVESGRNWEGGRTAWPWTVNDHGIGRWFDTKREAVRFVQSRIAAKKTIVDIGCFQVNWYWHGKAFDSVQAAFDPEVNADYAAKYLRSLYEKLGSWDKAVGRYHSGTAALAKAYHARVAQMREAVKDMPLRIAKAAPPPPMAGAVSLATFSGAGPMLRQASRPLIAPGNPIAVAMIPDLSDTSPPSKPKPKPKR